MKQRKFIVWLIALVVVCMVACVALAACDDNDKPTTEATYYLSVDGATYNSESSVPADVKFAKSNDVYTLSIELEEGKVLTVNKVGSSDVIGYDSLFSTAKMLTAGANNSMVVAESGTFGFTLDATIPELSYSFEAAEIGGGTEVTGVKLNKHELTLGLNGSEKLIATVEPSTALDKSVLWTSGNSLVATVADDGTVTAVAAGKTTITVTTTDGGFVDECEVTVHQAVTSINLSASTLTVYTGDGASTRELTVTINPSNATNQDYTVKVEQDGEVISYEKAGKAITITGKSVGTATLTVVSDDDDTITASCEITVKEISEAVPSLDMSNLVLYKGSSESVEVLYDGGTIDSFTVQSASTTYAKVTKSDSGNTFTVNGVEYGSTTVTVVVTYETSKTETLTLKVIVVDDSFVLEGTVGGVNNWNVSSSDAAGMERLFNETATLGVYSITRDLSAGDAFHIYPSGDYNKEIYASACTVVGTDSTRGIAQSSDGQNITIAYSGNYTMTLDFTKGKLEWSITVNEIYVDEVVVALDSDASGVLQVGATEETSLTATVKPGVATFDASSASWQIVESDYEGWLELTNDGLKCTVKLLKYDSEEDSVTVTISCTVNGVSGSYSLTLKPEGAGVKYVENVIWDTENVEVDIADGWTFTVQAHADGDETGVTYELVKDADGTALGSVLVNGNDGNAFEIDGTTGKITARMFGTVWVKATSVGDTEEGGKVTNITSVTFYASEFWLDIAWAGDYGESNPSTKIDAQHFEWNNVAITIASGSYSTAVVIAYKGLGSDWTSVIRGGAYLDKSSNNASGTAGKSGNFSVTKEGIYNVYLDLSGVNPSVKFEYVKDIEVTTEIDVTVNITLKDSSDVLAANSASFTENSDARTITVTLQFSQSTSWPTIVFTVIVNEVSTTYGWSEDAKNISGSQYHASDSSSAWTNEGKGWSLWKASVSASDVFTFVFSFDEYGGLTGITVD